MKTHVRKIFLFALMVIIGGIWGCKPDDPVTPSTPQDYLDAASTGEDLARMADVEDENWRFIEGEYIDNDYIEKTMACPLASWNANKDSLTLTFGTNGQACTATNGRSYEGSILAYYTGIPKQVGFTVNMLVNLKVNGDLYESTHKYVLDSTYFTATGDTVLVWSVQRNTSVTFVDGKNASFSGTFTIVKTKMTNGVDKVSITGSGHGINRLGQPYTFTMPVALETSTDCEWVYNGILKLTTDKGVVIEVDYGHPNGGQCDNKAEVRVDGGKFKREITLK